MMKKPSILSIDILSMGKKGKGQGEGSMEKESHPSVSTPTALDALHDEENCPYCAASADLLDAMEARNVQGVSDALLAFFTACRMEKE